MATIIAANVCVHLPTSDYERRVIEANRRLADAGIVRRDYLHLPWRDGLQRTHDAVHKLEQRGHLEPQS